jgi:hypothetical protein
MPKPNIKILKPLSHLHQFQYCYDEYDEIKNDIEVPPPSHPPDEITYSTLGSPIDATPITPQPIPAEIEFKLPSCLKNNQYASIQRDDTYPPI